MKKNLFLSVILTLFLVSCETENNNEQFVVDFEDYQLSEDGYYNGSDKAGEDLGYGVYFNAIEIDDFNFQNLYVETEWYGVVYSSWTGFAISSKTDSVTAGYDNQYSVMAGKGALGSTKFAVVFDTAVVVLPTDNLYSPKSVMLTNTTYAYKDMQNGSFFGKQFEAGDWFKVIIKGYLGTAEVGSVEYYLADFRDGKSILSKEWKEVDLSSLGNVNYLTFSFDSSDKGDFGVNTPKYACLDNLTVEYDEILK